jgi:hypothetical protein
LIGLGVLHPDKFLADNPIFSADLGTVAQANAAAAVYKLRQKNAQQKIRELSHA